MESSGLNIADTSLSLPQGVLDLFAHVLPYFVQILFVLRKHHSLKLENLFFFPDNVRGHFSKLWVLSTPAEHILFALMLCCPALRAFPSSEVLPSVHWYCLFPTPGSTIVCQLLVLCSSLSPPSPSSFLCWTKARCFQA